MECEEWIMQNECESDEDDVCEKDKGDVVERIKREEYNTIKKMLDPKLPTEKEVEDHERFHIPYRNWCPICVQAKGRDTNHDVSLRERKISEYCFDYCFPGDEFGFKLTVLAGRERLTGNWMATAVPTKGSSGMFVVDKCLEFMQELGDHEGKVIVKNDQEPSIQFLIKDLVKAREDGKTLLEESPVKSSGSNGVAERGIQSVEGQIRAIYLGFQKRMGKRIDTRERIVTFIPEYAAYLMNRLEEGKDGKVGYERIKGKKPTVLGLEFGEKLLYKIKIKDKLEKINARWEYGIFVGIRQRSGELWVGTPSGIIKTRAVKRIPVEKRWDDDCLEWIKGAPWIKYKGAEDADGDMPEGVPESEKERTESTNKNNQPIIIETRQRAPRDFYIKKEDAEKHGYTRGCGGCSSWFRGLGRQPHTEKCRDRFRDLLKDEARVKNQETRKKNLKRRN